MMVVVEALLPVLALIGIGYALRRIDFPGEALWRPAARLVYFVFLPALLLRLVANAELDPDLWRGQVAVAGAVLTITAALLMARRYVAPTGPAFTSVVQGSIRHNTYIGLAIGASVLTPDGLAGFALLVAVIVPLVNAIAVAVLGRYGYRGVESQRVSAVQTVRLVALNPLIVACALGVVLNVTGIGLPFGLDEVMRMLGSPALTLGLLVVGAGLRVGALVSVSRVVIIPTALRLVVYPLLAVLASMVLDVATDQLPALVLLSVLPTAASAYVLALELGGDEELMARIITVETLAALITIPIVLSLVLST